ncbi:MAG TPA: tetratricopeptide repeat protein, partial [Candidatus Polarisedimenticolia bacterium]|nr:tetratricopeptide repeat protein [Candidatus Polarisedimenticolia bacterium]
MNSGIRAGSRPIGVRAARFGALLVLLLLASPALAQGSRSDEALRTAREQSERKEFDRAAATLKGALRSDPQNKDMLSLLARVQAWSRHFDESIATYRKLLA